MFVFLKATKLIKKTEKNQKTRKWAFKYEQDSVPLKI